MRCEITASKAYFLNDEKAGAPPAAARRTQRVCCPPSGTTRARPLTHQTPAATTRTMRGVLPHHAPPAHVHRLPHKFSATAPRERSAGNILARLPGADWLHHAEPGAGRRRRPLTDAAVWMLLDDIFLVTNARWPPHCSAPFLPSSRPPFLSCLPRTDSRAQLGSQLECAPASGSLSFLDRVYQVTAIGKCKIPYLGTIRTVN